MRLPGNLFYLKQASQSDWLDGLQAELRAEQAAAWGRISRTLQRHIDEAAALRPQIEQASGSERDELVEQYGVARKAAERYYWFLIVQRESIGLYDHSELPKYYPLPGPLD